MYRETPSQYKRYNILLHCGGLGDLIAHLPAIKYIAENHPHILMDLFVHDYGMPLVEKVFEDYPQINIKPVSKIKQLEIGYTRSPYLHKIGNLSCHLIDHGFYTILGSSVEDKDKNYIQLEPIDVSKFNLPEKYIIVTTGFTSQTREWNSDSVNEVVDYIISKNITPVFIGKSSTQTGTNHIISGKFKADYSKGINLIDKTSILEAHGIMSNAIAVLGLDNGLTHLAGMTKVPIVMGFTTVEKRHRLPYRENILGHNCYPVTIDKKELPCIGCQSNWNFADITVDFKYCPLEDYKCVKMMTSNRWIEQLEKIL